MSIETEIAIKMIEALTKDLKELGLVPLPQAKCPICRSDPCSCMEDEDLDRAKARSTCNRCGTSTDMSKDACETCRLTGLEARQNASDPSIKAYKHKPLPAQALTSWPSIHQKMEVAKQLNELK